MLYAFHSAHTSGRTPRGICVALPRVYCTVTVPRARVGAHTHTHVCIGGRVCAYVYVHVYNASARLRATCVCARLRGYPRASALVCVIRASACMYTHIRPAGRTCVYTRRALVRRVPSVGLVAPQRRVFASPSGPSSLALFGAFLCALYSRPLASLERFVCGTS